MDGVTTVTDRGVPPGLLYEARLALHYAANHTSVAPGDLVAGCSDGLCPRLLAAEARASQPLTLDVELRVAAENLCRFAGRFSAGDIDVDRGDLQVAIDEVRAALGELE